MRDERAQQWGSVLTHEDFVERWQMIPEAFVLHAIHRSQVEYVASLIKGSRAKGKYQQAEYQGRFKATRAGFVESPSPKLRLRFPNDVVSRYQRERLAFREAIGVDALISESESLVRARANHVIGALATDSDAMSKMRRALHRVRAPVLDQAYPGWDSSLTWQIDSVRRDDDAVCIDGWAFSPETKLDAEFAIQSSGRDRLIPVSPSRTPRPDVAQVFPNAPLDCGFRIEVPAGILDPVDGSSLMVRATGTSLWDSRPLA
jgi:hypothetical protein